MTSFEPRDWTREGLREYGFRGFVPFAALPSADVPEEPGIYCVIRPNLAPPIFLAVSPAGRFKRTDQTVSAADLKAQWVQGATVVYIGKANIGGAGKRGLAKRLDEFRKFGDGKPEPHTGGRRIWQLADSHQLLVGWMPTADDAAASTETLLLAEFIRHHGRLPFANMRR